jgi:hypothetical protein
MGNGKWAKPQEDGPVGLSVAALIPKTTVDGIK